MMPGFERRADEMPVKRAKDRQREARLKMALLRSQSVLNYSLAAVALVRVVAGIIALWQSGEAIEWLVK
jgi:hypothetical protein